MVFLANLAENKRKVFCGLRKERKERQIMKNTFTIREIADVIGYTKPSISKAIKELGITPSKDKNTNILSLEQAKQIAAHFGKTIEALEEKEETSSSESEKALRRYIELLESQLTAKDELLLKQQETINQLVDSNRALSASIAASEAKALLAQPTQEKEQQQQQQETNQEEKKKGFWARLFG